MVVKDYPKDMTILLLRANHANEFELQNYAPIAKKLDIHVITTAHPLTPISLPTTTLWSPTELPHFPYRRQILNRLLGGEQWLVGLEKYIKDCYHVLKHSNKENEIIVHTAETYTPYTHQAVQLRKRGLIKKLICTCWETIPNNNEKFSRLRQWKQEAYQYVDLFHTPTQRAKQALIAEGVDPTRITVIPYGIDLKRFTPRPHAPHKRPLVLTVARLEIEKGMQDLELVAESLPDFQFLVVGQGSYTPRGSNIRVRSVPYSQIHRLYQRSDLFFLPSSSTATWEEQYGMALLESMACGIPVVTTRTGAIPEVVGDAGVLVKEGGIQSMTETIRGMYTDDSPHMRLSQAGVDRVHAHYNAKMVAKKLATLYLYNPSGD
jgi:starch synthase